MRHEIIRIFLLFCFPIWIYSCSSVPRQTNEEQKTAQVKEKKNSGTVKISQGPYNPSRTIKNDLLHTRLEVSFDWDKQHLHGQARLTFKPYFYAQDVLELDAKGMDIHSVKLISEAEKNLKYEYDKKVLKIKLDRTYTRRDTFVVEIAYTAKPNDLPKGGSEAITEDKGLYFINPDGSDKSKPRQIWTQGETEASSRWFPTIDSPNERTTQEMYITVDTGFTVLTNGEFIYAQVNANGTKTEYWKMDLPHAPYLFMMAIGKFAVIKDFWEDIEVNYYVEPEYAPYAKNIFGNTPEMIGFFSKILGYRFPWPKYSQVVVRDYVSGAMENTTATIFMEALQVDDRSLLDEHWDGIIAHELFHHWFGDLVTCESWSNLPLNESFANYSEYLWAEYKYGVDEADYLGQIEIEQYMDEAMEKQEPLIRYRYLDKEDMFDRHSYNKGGRILHMLRNYVGDTAFFASLSLYLNKNQFRPVEVHNLRLAFEEVTGEDLNWFFDQWFLSPGHPEIKISHNYEGGILKIKAEQIHDTVRTPVYRLPVNIDVWVNGMKETQRIVLEKKKQEFSFPLPATPNLVQFDPEYQVLGIITHEKSEEEWFFQYENSSRYLARLDALEHLFKPKAREGQGVNSSFANPAVLKLLKKALSDEFWAIREYALEQFTMYFIPEIESFISTMEKIALNDPKPAVRARAIYLISSYDNKRFTHIYKRGLEEKPYSVVGASLSSYLKTGDSNISSRIQEFEKLGNASIISALAEYYISSRDKSKFQWFREKMMTGDDRMLYGLLHYFAQYVKLLEGSDREDGKKVLKEIAKNNKHEVIRSAAEYYLKGIN